MRRRCAAAAISSRASASPDIVIANAGVSRGTLTERRRRPAGVPRGVRHQRAGHRADLSAVPGRDDAARRGTLVGIASVAGFRGLPGSGAYSASKAAAITYLESLRVELAGTGVAVVTVCPGFIATPMTANNPYRMPFLLGADKAARLIARAIARRRALLRAAVADGASGGCCAVAAAALRFAFARAPRKPRQK